MLKKKFYRRKKCHACHKLYRPLPQNYTRQKYCSAPNCQTQRIQLKNKRWLQAHPDYSTSRKIKHQLWRNKNPLYFKVWRNQHSAYLKRNRRLQKTRDAKKHGTLAKQTGSNSIHIDKLNYIRNLHNLAKQTGSIDVLRIQIDGICKFLLSASFLAKQTIIDSTHHPLT